MIEKIKSQIRSLHPRSPFFIAGVFSIVFITLILGVLSVRSQDIKQTRTSRNDTDTTYNPVSNFTPTPGKDYVEGQILVKFKEGISDVEINNYLAKHNARIKSKIQGINTSVVEVPVGQEENVRKGLIKDGIVKYAEFDFKVHVQFVPNDANFGNQWGLSNTGQNIKGQSGIARADINTGSAWDITKGSGVKVAVLDTGIDLNHPELSSKIVTQKSFTTSYVDDKNGHGTHVAGIIAAVTNNTQGVAGVCPDCQLIIEKVVNDYGEGNDSTVASAVTWAADNSAKVISMSLGTYYETNTLKDAVNYAWGKGSVLVAAAGNDNLNGIWYPAAYSNVISVAATNNKDQRASFSNYNSVLDVAAPGQDILSTLPTYQNNMGVTNYGYLSGTSQATPMVAGVVGLIWSSQYGTSNQAVVDRLYATADKITGTGTLWQQGRVNAGKAVGAATSTPSPTQPVAASTPKPTTGITPAPTFVCGGSPNSICNPTTTPGIHPTVTAHPTNAITQPPTHVTQYPYVTPTPVLIPTPVPNYNPTDPCLNPRDPGFMQQILNWVTSLRQQINEFINSILGNPNTAPLKITPPCITP